jgi:hypothetical protein
MQKVEQKNQGPPMRLQLPGRPAHSTPPLP